MTLISKPTIPSSCWTSVPEYLTPLQVKWNPFLLTLFPIVVNGFTLLFKLELESLPWLLAFLFSSLMSSDLPNLIISTSEIFLDSAWFSQSGTAFPLIQSFTTHCHDHMMSALPCHHHFFFLNISVEIIFYLLKELLCLLLVLLNCWVP